MTYKTILAAFATGCVLTLSGGLNAADNPPSGADYLAADLLSPCQEADNDARWGEAAETECEQYMLGFADALSIAGVTRGICLPKENRADEMRWAFMRWVHGDYAKRRKMSAGAAVMETLKSAFAC